MELSNVGAHCALDTCKQRDFLPFVCSPGCGKQFCLEHRTYRAHNCRQEPKDVNDAVECPKCGAVVAPEPGKDLNEVAALALALRPVPAETRRTGGLEAHCGRLRWLSPPPLLG